MYTVYAPGKCLIEYPMESIYLLKQFALFFDRLKPILSEIWLSILPLYDPMA